MILLTLAISVFLSNSTSTPKAPRAATTPPLQMQSFTHPDLGMTVIAAQVSLPPGAWSAVEPVESVGLEQLTLQPTDAVNSREERAVHTLFGLRTRGTPRNEVSVELKSRTGSVVEVTLDLATAESGNEAIFEVWAFHRARKWLLLAATAPDSVYPLWVSRAAELYGVSLPERGNRRWRRGRTTSPMNVLGGRAAIRETLQMQALDVGDDRGDRTVAISGIPGVQVKAHPFDEMVGDGPAVTIPLADTVPHDRFMVYFARPQELAKQLDASSDFLFRASGSVNESHIEYRLVERYLARVGFTPELVKMILGSGAVQELALIFPDLFFIDGTDATAILRVPQLARIEPALRLIGLDDLDSGDVIEKRTLGGKSIYWASRGDMLLVSTHRGELDRVLALEASDGAGSLGASAEFRTMLAKLPPSHDTIAYAYLSDPFIRRLVGPEVKIAQLRRLRARAALEAVSSGALLYRHDGHRDHPTVDRLAELGYVDPDLVAADFRLDENLVAHSDRYGTPREMVTLRELAVTHATPAEADAYKAYMRDYSRFWRQFFDPIALRLERDDAGDYEAEIFILPLLESSVYGMVRQFVTPHGDGAEFRVPELTPDPVLLFSANLRQQAWREIIDDGKQFFEELGADAGVLEEIGGAVHLAVLDGDPVLQFGSGDILGAFGGRDRSGFLGREAAFMIPIVATLFTRPCKLYVELRDEERARRSVRQLSGYVPERWQGDVSYSLTEIVGEDRWVLTFDFSGLVKMRYGIEFSDGFLVVSNIPWQRHGEITGTHTDFLTSAGVRITPGGAVLQLPGLHEAAREQERLATFRSALHLQALTAVGERNFAAAARRHHEIFGFVPTHPGSGSWALVVGDVTSSLYGTVRSQKQPAHEAGDRDFGLLRALDELDVSMQLEDDGLRTRLRWTPRKTTEGR